MRIKDFDYQYPEELVAQEPLPERGGSRMMVIDRRDFLYGDDNVGDEPGDEGNSDHGTWVLGIIGGYSPGELIGPAYNAEYLLAKTECSSWDSHIEEDNWIAGAE